MARAAAKRRGYRNVRRIEHNYFRGWVVSVKRRGERQVEYVRDGAYGGPRGALREALTRRDAIEAELPPPVKVKRVFSLNNTGEVGVAFVRQRTRAGRWVWYYVASWIELDGRRVKRSYSVLKYGKRRARAQAVQARREALARILAQRGARPWWQRRGAGGRRATDRADLHGA
jgi:AP2 domain